jgi:hypothetical protein
MSRSKPSPAAKRQSPALTPQQLIAIERERRARTCQVEIEALLKRHNCRLQPVMTLAGDKIMSTTQVIPLDVPEPPA